MHLFLNHNRTTNCSLSHNVSFLHVIARSEATWQSECRQYEFAEMLRNFLVVAARLPRQCAHWLAMTVEIDGFRSNSAPQHWSRGPEDVLCSTQHVTKCLRRLAAKLQFVSLCKNLPKCLAFREVPYHFRRKQFTASAISHAEGVFHFPEGKFHCTKSFSLSTYRPGLQQLPWQRQQRDRACPPPGIRWSGRSLRWMRRSPDWSG